MKAERVALNEKVGFIIPTTRTRTFSMSARRFSEVGAVQFRRKGGDWNSSGVAWSIKGA